MYGPRHSRDGTATKCLTEDCHDLRSEGHGHRWREANVAITVSLCREQSKNPPVKSRRNMTYYHMFFTFSTEIRDGFRKIHASGQGRGRKFGMPSEMITFLSTPVGKLNEHLKTLSCHRLQNPLSLRYHIVVSHCKNRRPCIHSLLPEVRHKCFQRAHRDGRFYSPEKSRKCVTLLDTSVMKHVFGCDTPEVSKIEHLKQIWTINSLNHFWVTLSCLGFEDVKHSPLLQTTQILDSSGVGFGMSQSRWSRRQLL